MTTSTPPAPAIGSIMREGFYARPGDEVAPDLLGKFLVVRSEDEDVTRVGRIVETEAYVGQEDLACHASKGLTKRTSTIFGPPGRAYVYLIYGLYEMFNVVAHRTGVPHAVLVRAVELLGEAVHQRARGDGPGRLTRALGIARAHNGTSLLSGPVTVHDGAAPDEIAVSARVGVAYAGAWADEPLRYFDAASPHVSRPSPRQLGSGKAGAGA